MLNKNLPISIAKKLLDLSRGDELPQSTFNDKWIRFLQQEEVIRLIHYGRTRAKVRIVSLSVLESFLMNHFGINNLQVYVEAVQSESLSGHEAQALAGDTKLRKDRTFKGFLVNSVKPVQAQLNGKNFVIEPLEGSFVFIYDYESFHLPENVTIVGIENPENFRQIASQGHLFPVQSVFVSRYPFSHDLKKWLKSIPNQYIHFGDIDLAGIAIFEHEFKPYLDNKASFFIPTQISQLLKENGSRKLYNQQYNKYKNLKSTEPELQNLINTIHVFKKGLEQEILIK